MSRPRAIQISSSASARQRVKIDCAYDKLVEIQRIKPNKANPNIHPASQVEKLAKIIQNHGWRHPLTVSNRSGLLVAGHCRLEAAKLLKLKKVPVDYQDFASDAEELAVLVADNKIAEFSEIDGLKMADILVELDQVNYDLDLTALESAEIEDYIIGPTDINDRGDELKNIPEYMTFVVTSEQRKEIETCLDKYTGANRTEQLLCLIRNK